jgi:recombination protein RecA
MKKSDEVIQDAINESKKRKEKTIIDFFSSGCKILDLNLGGGFAKGRMINIVGDKSTGKTLLTVECLVCNKIKNKDLKIIYDDAEAGFNFDTKAIYGIEIYKEDYPHSSTIEDFDLNFQREIKKVKENQEAIYVLDSFDAIGSLDEAEKRDLNRKLRLKGQKEKGDYGMSKQKKSGDFFKDFIKEMRNKNVSLFIISQVRENIGVMFGEKYKRSGGKALDFYASQIIWLAVCEKIIKNDIVVGVRLKVQVKKNKVGYPFTECFIDVLFDYGIDNITSNVYYLFDLLDEQGKLKKVKKQKKEDEENEEEKKEDKKSKLEFNNEKFSSVEELVFYIEQNNLKELLEKQVEEKFFKIRDSISTKNRIRKY